MKAKKLRRVGAALLCLLALTACAEAGAGAGTAASVAADTVAPSESSMASAPACSPAQGETVYDGAEAFLTAEQLEVFQLAGQLYYSIVSLSDNLCGEWPIPGTSRTLSIDQYRVDETGASRSEFVEEGDTLYWVYTCTYEELDELMHSVFTENYLAQTVYAQKFTTWNGHLAANDAIETAVIEGSLVLPCDHPGEYPDEYRLVYADEDTVEFTITMCYLSDFDWDWTASKPVSEEHICRVVYPIRLVRTDTGGWLVDEFHTRDYG